jgi:hypothetical protein
MIKEELIKIKYKSNNIVENVDYAMKSCNISVQILNSLLSEDKLKGGLLSLTKTSNPAISVVTDAVTPFFIEVLYIYI